MYYIGFSDLLQLVDKFFWIGGILPGLSCLYVKTITIAEITAVRISDTGIDGSLTVEYQKKYLQVL